MIHQARPRKVPKLKRPAKSIGVLFSGGLDSAALMGWFLDRGYDVHPIYITCGLRWERTELKWAKRFVASTKQFHGRELVKVPLLLESAYANNWSQRGETPGSKSPDTAVYLPARNLLLLIKALLHLHNQNVSTLALATLKGNPFPDARASYFKALEKILGQSFSKRIKILTPFRRMNKSDVIRENQKWPLHLSFSCISPKGIYHCGKCNKCAERRKAFREAGVTDRTVYRLGFRA
jgi:7-cyano-7-deazaguanine synthase